MSIYLRLFAIAVFCSLLTNTHAQDGVAINRDGSSADPSAILDISSDEAGLLMPRLTVAQRTAIATPQEGLIIYQTNSNPGYYYVKGGQWVPLNSKDIYHNAVTMTGAAPTVDPNGTFAATGITTTMVSTGVMEVSHPDFSVGVNGPAKLVTPFYFEPSTPPSLPADLCMPAFTEDCNNSSGRFQYPITVGVLSPPIAGLPITLGPPFSEVRICHRPSTGSCQGGGINYNYSGVSSPPAGTCGLPSVYNNFSTVNGLDPGDAFQLLLKGNNAGVPANRTAFSIFIDWNHDADFFDANEQVLTLPAQVIPTNGSSPALGSKFGPFTVPALATNGEGTMRVMTTRTDNNTNPCLTGSFGSTRDYSFFVSNGAAPNYEAQQRVCNISDQTATSFRVRCFDDEGAAVNNKVNIVINPN